MHDGVAISDLAGLQDALLAWGERERRDLPWRRTRDPWAILVSELMLQQTQVSRVVPKFKAFLARFPTPSSCAASPVSGVIELWAGLGYNRRAVNLHRAATQIVQQHDGRVPATLDALLDLSGIGPYTARAVMTFANEADVGVVDTNVSRVLARWTNQKCSGRDQQALADAVVPPGRGWAWNQMMFDLGSAICTRRAPECGRCPALHWCGWAGEGSDPAAPASKQSRFEGSDRQGRGALVDALRRHPVAQSQLATVMGWADEPDRARRVAATLVDDDLAVFDEVAGRWRLP